MQRTVRIGQRAEARFGVPQGGIVVPGRGADAEAPLDNPAVPRRPCRIPLAGGTVRSRYE